MRIVFMGTPDFAVPSLERIVQSQHEVAGVVTNPDRPSGRGRSSKASPVKRTALEHDIPLLQPEELQDPSFLRTLEEWEPDLQVVVAFRLLPEEVRTIPGKGTINLHASLLPSYRGAAPIQRALMNGERVTGLSSFFIDEGMDRGGLLLQERIEVPEEMTAGELHDIMAEKGSELLLRTIDGLEAGALKPYPQEASGYPPSKAPKLGPEDRRIDPGDTARRIHDRIRAMSPVPGVQVELHRHEGPVLQLKLLRTSIEAEKEDPDTEAGKVIGLKEDRILVGTGKGILAIHELQPAGKKAQSAAEFQRGYELREGDRFL